MIEFDYLVSEVSIHYNPKVKPSQRPHITCSGDVVPHLRKVWEDLEYRESMYLVLMNRGNKILGISKISAGGVSSTVFDVRMMLQVALKANASGLILAHNHPSGNLHPSENDKLITRKAKEACKMLDFQLLDHVILTPESKYSFADEGLI